MKQTILFLIVLIVGIGVGVGIVLLITPQSKIAYVNNEELYGNFTLKKELEIKLRNSEKVKKDMLDSMMIHLQVLSKSIASDKNTDNAKTEKLEFLRQQYLQKKQALEEENGMTAKQYTDQIWQQLNQYVKDYGEKHGYKFILGATGEGNVMYAEEKNNVTADMIGYVNERYNGKTN